MIKYRYKIIDDTLTGINYNDCYKKLCEIMNDFGSKGKRIVSVTSDFEYLHSVEKESCGYTLVVETPYEEELDDNKKNRQKLI